MHLSPAHAISQPDSQPDIEFMKAYEDILETGDLLVVARYNIPYASLPMELVSESFIGRFMTGTTELASVTPVPFNDRGYGRGVISFYFSAIQVTDLSIDLDTTVYKVVVQGNPTAFSSTGPGTGNYTENDALQRASGTSSTVLANDLVASPGGQAHVLERDSGWSANGQDLVDDTEVGFRLTSTGASYFTQAIVNLRLMGPDAFSTSSTSPDVPERTFDTTQKEGLKGFWAGTYFDDAINTITASTGGNRDVSTTLMLMLIMAAVAVGVKAMFGSIEYAVLTMAVTLPLGVLSGLSSLTFAAVIAFLATMLIGYVFLFRPSGV